MERLRKVVRNAIGVALPAILMVGCASTEKMTQTVKHAVKLEAYSEPATQMVCMWRRSLTPLPDPTRDGSQTLGLPGQMFLVTSKSAGAEANGDLAVVVYDETPRPAGSPAMRPEVWHYTKDTLKRLVTNDERFGKSFALFLPWPAHWRDVTTVKIMARYKSEGSPELFSEEVRIALDMTAGGPVWSDIAGGPARPGASGMSESRTSIPDPNKMLMQANLNGQPAQQFANPGTTPATSFQPPPQYSGFTPVGASASQLPPPVLPPNGHAWTPKPNQDNGPLQPVVIQRPGG